MDNFYHPYSQNNNNNNSNFNNEESNGSDFEMLYSKDHLQKLENERNFLKQQVADYENVLKDYSLSQQAHSQLVIEQDTKDKQINKLKLEIIRILQEKNEAQIKYKNLLHAQGGKQDNRNKSQSDNNYFYGYFNNNNQVDEVEEHKEQNSQKIQELQNQVYQLQRENENLKNEMKNQRFLEQDQSRIYQNQSNELSSLKMSLQDDLHAKEREIEKWKSEAQNIEFIMNIMDMQTFLQKQKDKIQQQIQDQERETGKKLTPSEVKKKFSDELKRYIMILKQFFSREQKLTFDLPPIKDMNE